MVSYSKAVVPNLGYVFHRGYVRNLNVYGIFKFYGILNENYMQELIAVTKFLFYCLVVREHKKVGNHCHDAFENTIKIILIS